MKSPFDSRQLKAFVSLARTGSVTQTAKELFLTHSAISHSMRALENDAGCRLLNRVGKRAVLTEAGEALLQHAERALAEMEEARQSLQTLNKWGFQRLRIATLPALASRLLARPLDQFRKEYPRIFITIETVDSPRMLEMLETHQADFAICEEQNVGDIFEAVPLIKDSLHVVVSSSHAWAGELRVKPEILAKEPCILPNSASPLRRTIEDYFATLGIVPNVIAESDDLAAIHELVSTGMGFGLLPGWLIQEELNDGSLRVVNFSRRQAAQTWCLCHRRARALTPAEVVFVRTCQSSYQCKTVETSPDSTL